MKKRCEKCGTEFEALQSFHKYCRKCFSPKSDRTDISQDLFLKDYYDQKGNLLKDVFVGVPERLSIIFAKDNLANKQLRDFFQKILRARNKALIKGIDAVRPVLFACKRDAVYQLKRRVISQNFCKFLEHHLSLAEKDERMLDGFCQHFESVIAYYPKDKGGY